MSVWFVRSALIYLGAGFTVGALLLFHKGVPLHPELWRLLPVHIEFLAVGWTLNLVLGVAYWMLPRFMRGAPRGDPRPAWMAYALLNGGVLAVSVGILPAAPAILPVLGRTAELLAAALFAIHLWPRVKPFGV